jgi:hypothetical protein
MLNAKVLATINHFHSSLIFAGKAKSLPFKWSLIRGSTPVGHKYQTSVEVIDIYKHCSLLQHLITVVKVLYFRPQDKKAQLECIEKMQKTLQGPI